MREIDCEALRETAQSYQSTLAWHQTIPDSLNVERDYDATPAAFKHHIRHWEVDIIANSLGGLEEAESQLNEQREYYEGVISDGSKRIVELEARGVQLSTCYDLQCGHPINTDERHVMIPKESGSWLYLIDLECALRIAGIRIEGEEHGNKTRGRAKQYRLTPGKRGRPS